MTVLLDKIVNYHVIIQISVTGVNYRVNYYPLIDNLGRVYRVNILPIVVFHKDPV